MPIGSMTSSAPTKRPLAADPLSAIAPLLRVRPEIQEICRFAARWEAEHQAEPLGWAQFHIVTKGRCFLEQRYGEPLLLQAGHLLLLPHGDAHVVRSAGRKGRIRAPILIELYKAFRYKWNTEVEIDTYFIFGRPKFHPTSTIFNIPPTTTHLNHSSPTR